MFYVFHLGTPLPSSKTSAERKTDTETHPTAKNVKTTEGVHIIVEKETSPTHTPEPTEPTPTPKKHETNTKISATPLSTEKTPSIVKVEVEQEQETGGAEKKLQEEDKEGVVVVQKVTEEEEEKKQTAEEPKKIKVVKVANDETEWDEEVDLESGKTGANEKPKERVGNAAVTTSVKTAEIGITVEKITPSPKSPTKSTQGEVVKVERVSSKQNVETKRSFAERIEEDEDLKVGKEAQSPDGEDKIEVTVEKESTQTSPAKESSSAKEIIIGVERVSPATDETDVEVKKVEVIAKSTVKPTTTKELPISQGNVEEVSISVEKITPSPKSSTKSTQSEVVKVERVSSKPNAETKRNFVERIEEDEDLKAGGEAQSPDGEEKIEVTVEKESTETSPAKESSSAKEIIIGVERVSPETDETDAEVKKVEVIAKSTVKPTTTKELPISQGNVEKVSISVEKITPSPKSSTKSTQSEVVKVERVSSKSNVETKRNFVERIEEDEDLKAGGEAQSPDGEEKIEVTVEKESTQTSPAKESSSAKEIIIGVERVSPAIDETDAEVQKVEVIAKSTVKPTTTKELPISQGNVEKVSISVEKITPSPKSSTKSTQSEVVKVERVSSKSNVEAKRNFVERIEEDEDLKTDGEAQSPDGEEKIEVTVEKESTETSPAKESSAKEIIVGVKRVSPATDETDEEAKTTVKPTTTKELPISQGNVEKVSISVEKITPSQSPTSGKSQTSMIRKVVKVTTTEDKDLETSQDAASYKRADDAPENTSDSEEEALELELEGGQDKMKTEKENVDEQKLAQEFDKALEAERNGKGIGIDKQLEKLNVEAAPEKVQVRKVMSDEELELAELAEETMNDEDKEEVKPTKNLTTATSQEVVTKVEKISKVTVQVTKEETANLPLSEKETAKEEKKLKVELKNELEQEKEEVSSRD